jgi:hypothetical protein
VNQEAAEVIEFMIADEIIPESYGGDEKRSVEDTSKGERVFEGNALIVETAMRKIGKVSFTGVPRE